MSSAGEGDDGAGNPSKSPKHKPSMSRSPTFDDRAVPPLLPPSASKLLLSSDPASFSAASWDNVIRPSKLRVGEDGERFDLLDAALNTSYVLVEHSLAKMDQRVGLFTKFVNTSEGRDKMFKVQQYGCRLVVYVLRTALKSVPFAPELAERLTGVEKASSLARKFLKLGNQFIFLRLFSKVLKEKPSFLKYAVCGRFLGLAMYFNLDNIVWGLKVGLFGVASKKKTAWWVKASLRFYLLSTLCTLAINLFQLFDNLKKLAALHEMQAMRRHFSARGSGGGSGDNEIGELGGFFAEEVAQRYIVKINKKLIALAITFVKEIFDFTNAANTVFEWEFNQGVRGALGLVSSLIGSYRLVERIRMQKWSLSSPRKSLVPTAPSLTSMLANRMFSRPSLHSLTAGSPATSGGKKRL